MKYWAYYDIPENQEENRNISLAACTKVSYISGIWNAVVGAGYAAAYKKAERSK